LQQFQEGFHLRKVWLWGAGLADTGLSCSGHEDGSSTKVGASSEPGVVTSSCRGFERSSLSEVEAWGWSEVGAWEGAFLT
jgi:hypothetical protein